MKMQQLKQADTIKSNVITTLTNYNTNTLNQFDGVFRYSKIIGLIDNTDTSIVSNITTLKIRKDLHQQLVHLQDMMFTLEMVYIILTRGQTQVQVVF